MSNVLSVIREHAQGLGESFPGMSLLRASYDVATMGDFTRAGMQKAFSKHIASFEDPKAAIDEVKKFAAIMDPSGQTGELLDIAAKADTEFQKGFQTALTNPEFLNYMQQGGSTLLDKETLEGLALDPNRAMERGFATQLLNQIGTNPIFQGDQADESFERLDTLGAQVKTLGEAYKALDAAKKSNNQAEIAKQQRLIAEMQLKMADDMRQLGVNVPEDVTPEIQEAMMNILTGRMKTDQAMDHLMVQLAEKGIDPEAIKSLDAMMRPLAGMMDYLIGPYAEFFRKHGPGLQDGFNTMMAHSEKINEGIFNGVGISDDPSVIATRVQEIKGVIQDRAEPRHDQDTLTGGGGTPTVRGDAGTDTLNERIKKTNVAYNENFQRTVERTGNTDLEQTDLAMTPEALSKFGVVATEGFTPDGRMKVSVDPEQQRQLAELDAQNASNTFRPQQYGMV